MVSSDYRTRLYERYVSAHERQHASEARYPFLKRLARELPDPSARVLELGAGRGELLGHLRELGFQNLAGIDCSPEQVSEAELRGIPVKLADATEALKECADASVDVLIAIDLLEHLSKPEVFTLLDECVRVLAPGGRMLIHTVNADSPFFGNVRYGDFTHETTFSRSSMRQVLRTVGFGEVDSFEDRPIVHGVKSALRAVVWEVVRTAAIVILAAETGSLDRSRILSQNFLTVAIKPASA